MWVAQLWRYPVKSMAGEPLRVAALSEEGVAGDRIAQVRSPNGHIITARTRPRLLGHRATLGPDGLPLVDGRPLDSEEVARDVEAGAGPGARLVLDMAPNRFDILPLLVVTDGALEAAGHDWRRFRPNLVIGGVPGLTERTWEGGRLHIGDVIIEIVDLRQRCIMTTFDPDSLEQNLDVLRRMQKEFGGYLGLNCLIRRAGTISIDDPVEFTGSGG